MTVTLRLAETIADAIIAKLQAGLATRVAAINAADTQGVTISTPTRFYLGGPDDGIAPPDPAIVVTILPGGQYGEEGPHSFIYTAELLVGVYDLDTSRQQLVRKLWRQARAVIETLWDDTPLEQLGSSAPFAAFKIHPVRDVPGPVFEPNADSQWSGLYGVVFRCDQHDGL